MLSPPSWVLAAPPPQPCVPPALGHSVAGWPGVGWVLQPCWGSSASLPTLPQPFPGMRARPPPSLGSGRSERERLVLPQRGVRTLCGSFLGESGGAQRAAWCSLLPHVGGRTFLSPEPAVGNSTPLLHLLLPPQASVREEGGRESWRRVRPCRATLHLLLTAPCPPAPLPAPRGPAPRTPGSLWAAGHGISAAE